MHLDRPDADPAPFGSYPPDDVVFVLKDLSHVELEAPLEDREEAIQAGRHYSEMLPIEYRPTDRYLELFHRTLAESAERVALAAAVTAERLLAERGPDLVIISLARAGTPVGVLLRRYLAATHGIAPAHYSISIIRGRGIDVNAVAEIRRRHPTAPLAVIDGWTGKGAIQRELTAACAPGAPAADLGLDDRMAVLADPGWCAVSWGTRDDFLIPSACLNATVSGLVSRTVLNRTVIGPDDFHGAKWYAELSDEDLSVHFVDTVAAWFPKVAEAAAVEAVRLDAEADPPTWAGAHDVAVIGERFGLTDTNLIKPGVGETTRVLLRRLPWKILVHPGRTGEVEHVLVLAEERGVPVEEYREMTYSCCGLIKPLR
jgi:hypothetical protein